MKRIHEGMMYCSGMVTTSVEYIQNQRMIKQLL